MMQYYLTMRVDRYWYFYRKSCKYILLATCVTVVHVHLLNTIMKLETFECGVILFTISLC